jgi:hypothetical protein
MLSPQEQNNQDDDDDEEDYSTADVHVRAFRSLGGHQIPSRSQPNIPG